MELPEYLRFVAEKLDKLQADKDEYLRIVGVLKETLQEIMEDYNETR